VQISKALTAEPPFLTFSSKKRAFAMRITSKGQITIPVAIREKAVLMPNTDFDFDGKDVRIRRATPARKGGRRGKGLTAAND
jgi:bifunctional DNA-binding transcriptional regulator/antitoxin component of YhaV-PrlF toxin-antitoxin module